MCFEAGIIWFGYGETKFGCCEFAVSWLLDLQIWVFVESSWWLLPFFWVFEMELDGDWSLLDSEYRNC